MGDVDRAAEAAGLVNVLSPEEILALVGLLEPAIRQELAAHLRQDKGHAPPIGAGSHPGGRGGGYKGSRGGKGPWAGYQQRSEGKGGGGGKGKGGGGGPRLAPPPLDHPEELPPCVLETNEQVAFQAGIGMPWQLVGPSGRTFRWDLQDRDAVPATVKQEVKNLLDAYARELGIPLQGDLAVKLALLRGDYWVSYAGGVSSSGGKAAAGQQPAPRADVIAGADQGLGPENVEPIDGKVGPESIRALYCK